MVQETCRFDLDQHILRAEFRNVHSVNYSALVYPKSAHLTIALGIDIADIRVW